jgi:hypothetical protein
MTCTVTHSNNFSAEGLELLDFLVEFIDLGGTNESPGQRVEKKNDPLALELV